MTGSRPPVRTCNISQLWLRFVPHTDIVEDLQHRLRAIPDEGMWIDSNGSDLAILPAHFLNTLRGKFMSTIRPQRFSILEDLGNRWDVTIGGSKTSMITSLLCAAFMSATWPLSAAIRTWSRLIRTLDIEMIAPQHGALFEGKAMVTAFRRWADSLSCGVDRLPEEYRLPPPRL